LGRDAGKEVLTWKSRCGGGGGWRCGETGTRRRPGRWRKKTVGRRTSCCGAPFPGKGRRTLRHEGAIIRVKQALLPLSQPPEIAPILAKSAGLVDKESLVVRKRDRRGAAHRLPGGVHRPGDKKKTLGGLIRGGEALDLQAGFNPGVCVLSKRLTGHLEM
jgi:hypothetical protein